MRDTERREELLAAEIAADWLQRLRNGGPAVRAEFARWLRESPRHIRDILLATASEHVLGHMKDYCRIDVGALKEQCRIEASFSVPHLMTETPAPPVRSSLFERSRWTLAAVAILVVVAAVSFIGIPALSIDTISTGPGEWRIARLADGSTLHLGPRTRVSVDITDRERTLHFARGELMVYVTKDVSRPFLVHTDAVTARALGTAFAVQRTDPTHVSVTVSEGVVGVTSKTRGITLIAGEQVRVTPEQTPLRAEAVDIARELAWVQGKLYLNHTVAEAIREMNLRSRRQVRLLDPTISERRIVGLFDAADPMAFAKKLERTLPVSIVDNGRGPLLLVARHCPDAAACSSSAVSSLSGDI